jgi:NAD-dependent SIR2 family protein deacetylase
MTRDNVIVLGAGFSQPFGGPLTNQLLDDEVISLSKANHSILILFREYQERQKISKPDVDFSIEDLFTDIWRRAKTGLPIPLKGKEYAADAALKELVLHLASFTKYITFDRRKNLHDDYIKFFKDWIKKSNRLTIISFNYDLLVEQILDELRISYDYGNISDYSFVDHYRQRRSKSAKVSILKLHGSVNWGVCEGCKRAKKSRYFINVYEKPYIPVRRQRCRGYCNQFVESGIVPPVVGKAGEIRYLKSSWTQAADAIRRTDHLFIIGYSLPENDHEAFLLLQESRKMKQHKKYVICGSRGSSKRYQEALVMYQDHACYFEYYLQNII